MRANEYIKKYSIDKAKELVSSIINTISVNEHVCIPCFITDEGEYVGYKDLKRLVGSYELVERYGTVDEAKEYLPMLRMGSYDELKQAIEDVESCL